MQDRLAFGLTASHLSYLLIGSLAGYALLASRLPGAIRYPLGVLCIGAGALLAWGRLGQRSLDTWAWLALRFYLRPRRSPVRPGAANARLDTSTPDGPGSEDEAPEPPVPEPQTPRILTLPRRDPYVADGGGDYRVDPGPQDDPRLEPGPAPIDPAPVFLAATQRIAFFSLKGGVGKTTLATEVATLLAHRGRFRRQQGGPAWPLRVALLDLDLGSANISMKLGLTHPTIWDLVLDPEPDSARVDECLVLHQESGLRVLLGPPRAIAAGETRALAMQRLAQVLSHLDDEGYHFVFIDLSGEVDELTTYALEACHHVYYVMTPTASGVQDTYRGVETLRRMGHRRKLRFVLNQARHGFNPDEVLADLGGSLAATIPQDDAFAAAEDEHRPVCLGDRPAATAIGSLAATVYPGLENAPPRAGRWRRLGRRLG